MTQGHVVVLGMHRSGTSLAAGILTRLGVELGDCLIAPSYSNPLGHFEDRRFVDLNNDILAAAGGSWDSPPGRASIIEQEGRFSSRIADLLADVSLGGWKDPRTSLTIDLFRPHLRRPKFVVCHRKTNDIARSLRQRGDMTLEKGASLADHYNFQIEGFFRRHPSSQRLDLRFEDIIVHSGRWVDALIEFTGLEPSSDQRAAALGSVKPHDVLRRIRRRGLLVSGLLRPWEIPRFIFRKLAAMQRER